ncbi:MAG: ThuA domain-containing protein [Pirellulales bacterium]|nr:ThuA domain-containing protein [Pirellulales bacterium]
MTNTFAAAVTLWGLLMPMAGEPGSIKALVVTGYCQPTHNWKETTAALQDVYKTDARFDLRVVEDPAFLESPALANYDVVLLNFEDYQRPNPGDKARANLQQFVESGKGVVLLHSACAAWNESPEFVTIAGRIWKEGVSGNDPKGAFKVDVLKTENPIVKGLESYDTDDELFYSLEGAQAIEVLATAKSKITGKDEPMAFIFPLAKGRVFNITLGHDAASLHVAGTMELLRRGAAWAAGQPAVPEAPAAPAAQAAPDPAAPAAS